ncbi:alkene reductase [Chitinophaga pinensis]|uniref:Alkene reductase n=1 Tax=Chitinophaga pinensis TaxID=79329 RepID=A0A5C6LWD6_9BACT|nr:alkene reductase [Chitinophaga pinensis]TWV99705.1 alkene reductase [Chitinophaga pinensis]
MNAEKKLLTPLITPSLSLSNRVVMAPMSRRRSSNGIPGATANIYYRQRAGAGLIIAENSAVAANGIGYLDAPGIYNEVQKTAWKKVVDEVHAANGKIFIQLVHTGRIGHPLNHENSAQLVAPSVVRAAGEMRVPGNLHLSIPAPLELSTAETQEMVQAFVTAALNAIEVGFDGVEVHGAHGFLIEQFLHPHTNHRTDQYGGSMTNRARFLLEVTQGIADAIGKERTGIRLSPFAVLNDLPAYKDELATHQYITAALEEMGILYIHLSSQPLNGQASITEDYIRDVRSRFSRLLIVAGAHTAASAEALLQAGLVDLVAFGRPFIANPDLVERFRQNKPLSPGDVETFYQGGDKGYVDYPVLYEKVGPCKV